MTTHFSRTDIDRMEKRYRTQFINSLAGFKSANLVGTMDTEGRTNLAIVNSVIHLGANPPLMGMVTRPRRVERHTVDNLLSSGYFTLNHVHTEMVRAAHQTSARYAREQSEFEHTGLTPEYRNGLPAPFVQQSRLAIGLRLRECKHLDVNDTDFIIGEIVDVYLAGEALGPDGYVDIEAIGTVAISGLDSYHQTQRLERLAYAKPDRQPRPLDKPTSL